jgi:hypothetical protein
VTDPLEEAFADALAGGEDPAVLAMAADREPIKRGEGRPEDGYLSEGRIVPSVTEVLQCWGEPGGLIWWATDIVMAKAAALGVTIDDIENRTAAYWEAKKASDAIRDNAGVHGTALHQAIEDEWNGRPVTIPEAGSWDVLSGWRRAKAWFAERPHLVPTHTEHRLAGPKFGGTCDWTFRDDNRDGATVLGDLKTGRTPSETWLLQLGAYAHLWPTEVDAVFVLHVPRDPDKKTGKVKPARAYWLEGEGLRMAIAAFRHIAAAYHLCDPLRRQVGKKPRIKITAPAA